MNDATQPHASWTPEGEVMGPPTEDALIAAICTVFDPEIPVNIYELGLIYAIEIDDEGGIKVEMTLTAPACPSAQELPEMVQNAVLAAVTFVSIWQKAQWRAIFRNFQLALTRRRIGMGPERMSSFYRAKAIRSCGRKVMSPSAMIGKWAQ